MVKGVAMAMAFLAGGPSGAVMLQVNAPQELSRLLLEVDKDHDRKITVLDQVTKAFQLKDLHGERFEVAGTYSLSNLLQELKLAEQAGPGARLDSRHIFENPVRRISRSIREIYWDHLTRRVDADHLAAILNDDKIPLIKDRYLYVPPRDEVAYAYFTQASQHHPELNLRVLRLPVQPGRMGVLSLALEKTATGGLRGVPFVVPGGRFNEMYGWDSYFEALGLIADGRVDLAKAMVDNFVYQIENYGQILNANRSYYLNRSQPPFLTSMIEAVYPHLKGRASDKKWLLHALKAAIREYRDVWMGPLRLTPTGLSRYSGNASGVPPEVESGHFDFVLKPAALRLKLSVDQVIDGLNRGTLQDPALVRFFAQDLAVRESGHDTTYRWHVDGEDRAADFVTVDLNALLYKCETDLARLIQREFGGQIRLDGRQGWSRASDWKALAERRKTQMFKLLWDPERKLFFDYNYQQQIRSKYLSATAFYPLWAKLLSAEQAHATVAALLKELEMPGGLAATSPRSLAQSGDPEHLRQWDYPNGWAPHQMIAWVGLANYNERAATDRLIYKWLYMITRSAADYNGVVPEKFDVVKRSHAVFAEYGNVGTNFSYITEEGFGWMNASYQVGLAQLSSRYRQSLESLIPPEWLEF